MSVRRNLSIVLLYLALGFVTCNCKLAPARNFCINYIFGDPHGDSEILTHELSSCPASPGAPALDTDKLIAQILEIDGSSSLLKAPLYLQVSEEEEQQVVAPPGQGEETSEEDGQIESGEGLTDEDDELTEEDIWNPNWGEGDNQGQEIDDLDDADYEEELEDEEDDDDDYWIGDDDWEDDFDYIDNKETDDNSEE